MVQNTQSEQPQSSPSADFIIFLCALIIAAIVFTIKLSVGEI